MKDEFALIRSLLQHRNPVSPEVEVDVGDDAAVLRPREGISWVFTCDTMVETVHFLRETMGPEDLGWRCLAANISDVAAMGGIPFYALVSLAVPDRWDEETLAGIYRGMRELSDDFGVQVVGGDTVRSPEHLILTISLLGGVEPGHSLLRSAAQPGDVVFVMGELGRSAAGLHLLSREDRRSWFNRYPGLVDAYRRPIPQVEAGRLLLQSGVSVACNDLSDGLAREATEIAEASGVRLVLDADRIPLCRETRAYAFERGMDPLEWALSGGEDFQLVCTAPGKDWPRLHRKAGEEGITLFPVGWVEKGAPGVDCIRDGKRLDRTGGGYNHFANG